VGILCELDSISGALYLDAIVELEYLVELLSSFVTGCELENSCQTADNSVFVTAEHQQGAFGHSGVIIE
jgi:hypothetical protein